MNKDHFLKKIMGILIVFVMITASIAVGLQNTSDAEHWSQDSLLSRDPKSYTTEILSKETDWSRRDMVVEKARSNYYGAVYRKEFDKAYEYLAPTLRHTVTLANFKDAWQKKIKKTEYKNAWSNIEFGWVKSFKILRTYDGLIDNKQCVYTLVRASISIAGHADLDSSQQILDVWLYDSGRAYIFPEENIKLNASSE